MIQLWKPSNSSTKTMGYVKIFKDDEIPINDIRRFTKYLYWELGPRERINKFYFL